MYDPTTASLIQGAPTVGGFDPAALPDLLTEAYASIASLRMSGTDPGRTLDLVIRLRTLATTLEVHACVQEDSDGRRSAAFVAATAHRFLFEVADVLGLRQRDRQTLTTGQVSSDLSAALLFLAAGYPADAAEVVGAYDRRKAGEPTSVVVRAVYHLATGKLEPILALGIVTPDEADEEEQAVFSLWARILDVVARMATRMLMEPSTADDSWAAIRGILGLVRDLAVARIDIPGLAPEGTQIFSAYPGPHHLATLLLAASRGFDGGSLADAPAPGPPVSADRWRQFVRSRAKTKPYLWTNHMEAVREGLLEIGKSAAVSFPTGAGKSTLSELKIASTIVSGRKVVYLAPTHALVGQVSTNLRELIPDTRVEQFDHEDGLYADLDALAEKDAVVMTPERCLLLIGLFPHEFSEVGLIVFDECHLLHCDGEYPDRRSLDAMLCLLRLLESSPDADVLLMSAMVSNGRELAEWLRDAHGKEALSFDAAWKPTRQARASLVFDRAEIGALQEILEEAVTSGRNLPQRRMRASAYTLVSLKQRWVSNSLSDYRLLRLLAEPTKLKAARDRYGRPFPTIDAKGAAIDIASQAAERGLKVIVFMQNPLSVPSCVSTTGGSAPTQFDESEQRIFDAAATELGGAEFMFAPQGRAGGHFGSLIKVERDLVESSFKRSGGISILFSTNTLAQGMNLPADLVVIAKTGAYDAQAETYRQMDTHDLLNAAGRAGRAGLAANGFVLVIPDKLVTFGENGRVTGAGLGHLKDEILAQDDRCLTIADPLEVLLDRCHVAHHDSKLVDSLAIRLPADLDGDEAGGASRRFLAKSLAAAKAIKAGRLADFEVKVESMLRTRSTLIGDSDGPALALASAIGWKPELIAVLVGASRAIEDPDRMSAYAWAEWALDWLSSNPGSVEALGIGYRADRESLGGGFRTWIAGMPLREVELSLGTSSDRLGHLSKARRFAKGPVRDISYLVGLVAQVAGAIDLERKEQLARSASRAALLIREGLDSLEKVFLVRYKRESYWTRARVEMEAAEWLSLVERNDDLAEEYSDAQRRTMRGIRAFDRRTRA